MLGAIPKDQPTSNLAPDLRMAPDRLQPDWILDWLKNPAAILPGTRMPAFWPDYPKSPYPQIGGDAEAQIRAIRDYLLTFRGGRRRGRSSADGELGQVSRVGQAGRLAMPARPPTCPTCLPARYNSANASASSRALPRVHPTAYIDDSAQVIGDVEIGEESSVWMYVVIRGDVHRIRIGRRSNVQDGTVVHVMKDTHPTTIGDDVTIGHARRHPRLHDRGPVPDRHGRHPAERRAHRQRLDRRRRRAGRRGHAGAAALAGHGQPREGEAAADRRRGRRDSCIDTPDRLRAAIALD